MSHPLRRLACWLPLCGALLLPLQAGAVHAQPRSSAMAAQALDEAAQFAQATGAQALIVVQAGAVQLERYFGGAGAATPVDADALAATMALLAVGAAITDGRVTSLDAPLPVGWRAGLPATTTLRQLLAAGNLAAAQQVLERATGMPYRRYLSRRLWQRLDGSDGRLPQDWLHLGQMLLDGGRWQGRRVLSKAFVDAQGLTTKDSALGSSSGLLLTLLPADRVLVLRTGASSPAWRDRLLPQLLRDALHPNSTAQAAADWAWLYDWRLQTRASAGNPWVWDPARPIFWPTERVAGGHAAALPRRSAGCLTEAALTPALAELERVKSYSLLVWRDGAIEVEHYRPGFNADTRAESASMHKSVLGLLVGQAVADGFIPSIDLPVSRWLTEWAGDPRGAITVRQLLQMAGGLAPIKFDMAPGAPNSRFLLGADANAVPLASTLADAPGSRFNYGSSNSQLLGLIVQRATGVRYAQYLSQRLWQPLGAADAAVALDRPGGMARTSGSLLARADDWLRLGLLFIERGRVGQQQVVSADWLDAMAAPSPANPNYGLQLWRGSPHAPLRGYNSATTATVPARQPFLADDMLFFDGAGAQRVYMSAREQLVIVRTGAPAADWDDSLLPNIITTAARACKKSP